MRWLTRCLFIVLIVMLAIVTFFLTPYGFHQSIRFAQRHLPGTLTFKKISGTPFGPINIVGLGYKNPTFHFSADHVHLEWQLPMLLLGKIDIINFQANNIHILDKSTAKIPENAKIQRPETQKLHLPLGLIIKSASIKQIDYHRQYDKAHYKIKSIVFRRFKLTTHKISGAISVRLQKPYSLTSTLLLNGKLSDYHFNWNIKRDHETLNFVGNGNKRTAYIALNNNVLFGGSVNGRFWLQWFPHVQWQTLLKINNVDLKKLDSMLPQIHTASIATDGTWEKTFPNFSISSDITFPSGKITLQGKHQEQWDMQWNIVSSDLSQLVKGQEGDFNMSGTITGPSITPTLKFIFQGKNLAINHYRAETLSGKTTLDLSWKTPNHIEWTGTQIKTPSIALDFFHTIISSTQELHQINTHLEFSNDYAKNFILNTQLTGMLKNNLWQGKINTLAFSSNRLGSWRIKQPSSLLFSQEKIELAPLCIASTESHSCISTTWNENGTWSANAKGNLKNLNVITGFIAEHLTSNAAATYEIKAAGTNGTIQKLHAYFNSQPGNIFYQRDFENLNVPFHQLSLTAKIINSQLVTNFQLNRGSPDFINATVTLDGVTQHLSEIDTLPIHGNLRLHFSKLNIFQFFIPYIDEPTGVIEGNINIGGSLQNPSFQGNLELIKSDVSIPQLKLKIQNVKIAMHAENHTISYTASAQSGEQTLSAKGKTLLKKGSLLTEINLTGNSILISNTPEYTIYASPDLTLKTVGHSSVLSGSIHIPSAIIKPADFSSTTTLSDDAIIVSEEDTNKKSPWNWIINLKVSLGDDIVIDTHGLKGKLTGNLQITRDMEQPTPVATGQLRIVTASFHAQGKQLTISPNSYIGYLHDSLSNPHLNLRAYRMVTVLAQSGAPLGPTETKVGIDVKGTVKHPNVTMFSTPANLSQADILSYLLFNQPTSGSSSSNISLILQAVKSLKLTGKSEDSSISQVQQALGITELGVQQQLYMDALGTPFGINQSAFVVGKYVTPNIYIRYNHGLVTSVDIYEIRYIINKNWALQTDIGTTRDIGSGMDILYNISRPHFPW